MMDLLDETRIEQLNTLAGHQAQALLGGPVRVLFFDCTTLYFESFSEDELKQPGYSKDAKFKGMPGAPGPGRDRNRPAGALHGIARRHLRGPQPYPGGRSPAGTP